MKRWLVAVVGVFAALLVPAGPVAAASAGTADGSYGTGGQASFDSGLGSAAPVAAVRRSDGGTIVAARATDGHGESLFLLAITSSGAVDRTFGTNGRAATGLPANIFERAGLTVDGVGRIVAAVPGQDGILVGRYLPDGTPDATWGTDGIQRVPGRPLGTVGVAVQPISGRVIVAATLAFDDEAFVVALRETGVDPTFGVAGRAPIRAAAGQHDARAVRVDGDTILVAGGGRRSPGATERNLAVTRLLATGAPDPTFAGDGTFTAETTADGGSLGIDLEVDDAGRVLAGGPLGEFGYGPATVVSRLLANGLPDPTFGDAGLTRLRRLAKYQLQDLAVADGDVLVAVTTATDGTGNVLPELTRLNSIGRVDPSYGGGDGHVAPRNPRSRSGDAASVLPGSGGSAVLVSAAGSQVVASSWTATGAPVTDFGVSGQVELAAGRQSTEGINDLVVTPAGTVVVGTNGYPNTLVRPDAVIARFTPSGRRDTAFGDGGAQIVDGGGADEFTAVAVDGEGRLVAVGTAQRDQAWRVLVARFLPSGRPDPAFGTDGVLLVGEDVAGGNQSSGTSVVVVGSRIAVGVSVPVVGSTEVRSRLVGLTSPGTVDSSFGGGAVDLPVGGDTQRLPALAVTPSGIVAAGILGSGSGTDLGATKVTGAGAVDLSYGVLGLARVDVEGRGEADRGRGVAATADGGVVLLGSTEVDTPYPQPTHQPVVARFGADGRAVQAFGNGGSRVVPIPNVEDPEAVDLAIDAMGRIVFGLGRTEGSFTGDSRTVRLLPTGALDPAFDGDGITVSPIDLTPDFSVFGAVGVDASDRVIVGGSAPGQGSADLAVARILPSGDPLPVLDVGDATAVEGEDGRVSVRVTLSRAVDRDVSVAYAWKNGTAVVPDYESEYPGRVLVRAGATEGSSPQVSIRDDDADESDETVRLELSDPDGAAIGDGIGTVTIIDEDPGPFVSVADVQTTEGGILSFGVTLSEPSPAPVRFRATTRGGSAVADVDFAWTYRSYAIPAGSTSLSVEVSTIEDDETEATEHLEVVLTELDNGRPERTTATGTIDDDDAAAPSSTTTTAARAAPATTSTTTTTSTTRTTPERPSGYWMVAEDGRVFAFGAAGWSGDAPVRSTRAVDLEPTPSRSGYWVVGSGGDVYAFGDAPYLGGSPALRPGETVTSLSAHPSGRGYWLFSTSGRVFAFGEAPHFGDMGATRLNGPVLDSVPTPSGRGYYLVASDGGIFTFGDATFQGSMGGVPLNAPVQSLVPDGDGVGYWLVASDGGIFTFGADFHGSMGAVRLNRPITGMVGYPRGYLMVGEDGGIFTFGDAAFHGSLGDRPPARPVTSVAAY